MKKLLSIIICFILINSMSFANVIDIKLHWAYDDIVRNINNEYINGYPDNTFKPDDYIKTNELLKILVKIMENSILPLKQEWDKPFIEYGINVGLIKNDEKKYNEFIIRKDCFEIMYNYMYINLKDSDEIFDKQLDNTNDKINLLFKIGIVNGYPDNSLRLENYITRAETTKLINKAIDYIDSCVYKEKIDISFFNKQDICDYTNYINNEGSNSTGVFLNNFRILNKKVFYTDLGRYGNYSNKYIDKYNQEIIDILKVLINKNNYVLNTYLDSEKCIVVSYGEKKEYVFNNNVLFEIIMYEKDRFLDNDYTYNVQINVYQLWKELNEIKNQIKINKYYLNKLVSSLDIFLDEEQVSNIKSNIIQNNEEELLNSNSYLKKVDNSICIYINTNK